MNTYSARDSPAETFLPVRNDGESDTTATDGFRPLHELVSVVLAECRVRRSRALALDAVKDFGQQIVD